MMELTVSHLLWIPSENSNDCLYERMFPVRQTELIYQRKLPLFYQHNTRLLRSELFKYLPYTLGIQIPIYPALYWMDFPQILSSDAKQNFLENLLGLTQNFLTPVALTHAYSHTHTHTHYLRLHFSFPTDSFFWLLLFQFAFAVIIATSLILDSKFLFTFFFFFIFHYFPSSQNSEICLTLYIKPDEVLTGFEICFPSDNLFLSFNLTVKFSSYHSI